LREERRLRALMQFTKSEALVKPGIEQDRDDDNPARPAGIGSGPATTSKRNNPYRGRKPRGKRRHGK